MDYLVCENCGEYYKLQEGESADDYSDICKCGGKLDHYDYIPLDKVYKKCPRCGFEVGYSYKPLGCICPKCNNKLVFIENECPIRGSDNKFEEKILDHDYSEFLGAINTFTNCRNSFGIIEKIENKRSINDYILVIIVITLALIFILIRVLS